MKAIMKHSGRKPCIVEIENELSALQKAVGGSIKTVTFAKDCCIICNEEGRLLGLPHNIIFCGVSFAGTILAVGISGDRFIDLSEEATDIMMYWLNKRGE